MTVPNGKIRPAYPYKNDSIVTSANVRGDYIARSGSDTAQPDQVAISTTLSNNDNLIVSKPVTIASGQTVSSVIDCGTKILSSIDLPSALTGTSMTFQGSYDGVTYDTIKDIGGASNYSITVAASSLVPVKKEVFEGIKFIKLVSGSAEGAGRTIVVNLIPRTTPYGR